MIELAHAIPDGEVFFALEPEKLVAKMLFLLRRLSDRSQFFLPNMEEELDGVQHGGCERRAGERGCGRRNELTEERDNADDEQ